MTVSSSLTSDLCDSVAPQLPTHQSHSYGEYNGQYMQTHWWSVRSSWMHICSHCPQANCYYNVQELLTEAWTDPVSQITEVITWWWICFVANLTSRLLPWKLVSSLSDPASRSLFMSHSPIFIPVLSVWTPQSLPFGLFQTDLINLCETETGVKSSVQTKAQTGLFCKSELTPSVLWLFCCLRLVVGAVTRRAAGTVTRHLRTPSSSTGTVCLSLTHTHTHTHTHTGWGAVLTCVNGRMSVSEDDPLSLLKLTLLR